MRTGNLAATKSLLGSIAFIAISSGAAWSACQCNCSSGGQSIYTHTNNNAAECKAACGFDSQVYGGPLTPGGSCMTAGPPGPPPPPLPINVDFCADPNTHPAVTKPGNDTGLLGVRTGVSCIQISDTIKQYRTWCHAWVEQYPGQIGNCVGANNTSTTCGPFSNVQRQFGSVDRIAGSQYNVCVHVENQDHGRTLHFIMEGAPY
jgi:hypothetical protein